MSFGKMRSCNHTLLKSREVTITAILSYKVFLFAILVEESKLHCTEEIPQALLKINVNKGMML